MCPCVSNWNFEVLVFEEIGKQENREENLSERGRDPATNLTLIWHQRRDLNPRDINGRRVLSSTAPPLPACIL